MRKKRVKIGKFKTVFKGITFEVRQARTVLPSGRKVIFERAIRPSATRALAFDNKGRLLLVREFRPRQGKYLWGIPGGRIDKGETPRQATQRELQEEAGVKAKRLALFHFEDMSQSIEMKSYAYIATGLTPATLHADDGEDVIVVPTPLKKAVRMVLDGEINGKSLGYLILKLYALRKKFRLR